MTNQITAAINAYEAKQRANWKCEICGVKQGTQRNLTIGYRTYNVSLSAVRTVRDGQPVLIALCERCRNKVPRRDYRV
jgi:hypothetical protein